MITRNSPVVVMSNAYSQARRVQDIIATGTELTCTSGTGIIPLCAAAADTWRRVEDRSEQVLSQLAVSAIRALITAQMTAILATAGKSRWCELTSAAPATAEPFLQLFPQTAFLCVHSRCLDVIRTAARDNPWGLVRPGFTPYLLSHAGNSVAALAAYWVAFTEELLAFEKAHSDCARRVRYEDVFASRPNTLAAVRAWLMLADPPAVIQEPHIFSPSAVPLQPLCAEVPVEMIPAPLRERINQLHAELTYPSLE